ncbi:MAG: ATP-binding protein [Microcoleaceae cyanobacterium]
MTESAGTEPLVFPYRSRFQAPTTLDALSSVLLWFDQVQLDVIPRPVWLRCQLALAEGFTNAVRHAHRQLSRDQTIEIEAVIFPKEIELRIWDYGPVFDKDRKLDELPASQSKSAGGGRGLRLLRDIADELSYTRTSDHRNCLFIRKYYKPVHSGLLSDEDDSI